MNYTILRLLTYQEADRILAELAKSSFQDGKLTAQGSARDVKHNLQVKCTDPEPLEIETMVMSAIQKNSEFELFAYPKRITRPMFSRYDPGMAYGSHVDGAFMGAPGGPIRTDLSMTLFLSPPGSYDGGELVIDRPMGQEEIKLDAGEAILYSSSSIHRVEPVTRGCRMAAICWIQSAIRDERLREILYDLGRVTKNGDAAKERDSRLLLGKSYHNLLRYAAEL